MELCTNKAELDTFLRQNADLHLYAIGDLDDFFWPYCRYWVRRVDQTIIALVLIYQTDDLPIVMALGDDTNELNKLLQDLLPTLGPKVYAHISPGCEPAFLALYRPTYHETQERMILDLEALTSFDAQPLHSFTSQDADRLSDFYEHSYPQNWFDTRMLELQPFVGYLHNHQLVSVAGIHSYSAQYRVAALGNITTHPDFRGKGYARHCTAALCQQLSATTDLIGLNVNADNIAAKRSYERVGFKTVARFTEMMLERKEMEPV